MCNKLLFIVSWCVLALGISQAAAEEKPLTIITEDWPPYNYEENGDVKGFSTEIVQAILDELDLKHKITVLPGARGEKLLDEGTRVMSFSLFRTPEREERYKWIGPISEEAIYFYKKKGSPLEITTLEDAKRVKRVACQHKGLIFNTLQQKGFNNLDTSPLQESVIKKIALGRTDLSVNAPPLGIAYFLKKANLPADSLEQTPVELLKFPLYIACTKDIPDDEIQQWQAALEKIKASETYTQIYNKYLGK